MIKILGRIICKLNGTHRYKVTETWDSDRASYSPCLRCGIEKKHYKEGEFTDMDGNECFGFSDGSCFRAFSNRGKDEQKTTS